MALNFPLTEGQPTDGSFQSFQATSLGDVLYAWSGVYWYAVGTVTLGDLAKGLLGWKFPEQGRSETAPENALVCIQTLSIESARTGAGLHGILQP